MDRTIRQRTDPSLIGVVLVLLALGAVMVASSSMMIAQTKLGHPFHYFWHQIIYILLGLCLSVICYQLPLQHWYRFAPWCLGLAFLLLVLVFIPGLGRTVNGSVRWLNLGFITFQVSEFAKAAMILYMAYYLALYGQSVREKVSGFLKPLFILGLMVLLLLLEPDFGAAMVVSGTTLMLLFLGGVSLYYFMGLLIITGCGALILIVVAPYRLERLTSFLDPWAQPYDSGYQLTQALIAFGRGEWLGVGLGTSMQKLFYLPEAHTDFVFAVLSEECGLLGGCLVLGLYTVLVCRGFSIAHYANDKKKLFASYLAYGLSVWLGIQILVNVGVNTGLLPTKGLTLPFMSYGGSSLLMDCMAVGLLLRVDRENKRV
jgi:cell division protein FtsW